MAGDLPNYDWHSSKQGDLPSAVDVNQALTIHSSKVIYREVGPTVQTVFDYREYSAFKGWNSVIATDLTTTTTSAGTGTSTTVNVISTVGFPTTGSITVGALTFSYTGITATSFTGLTLTSGSPSGTWSARTTVVSSIGTDAFAQLIGTTKVIDVTGLNYIEIPVSYRALTSNGLPLQPKDFPKAQDLAVSIWTGPTSTSVETVSPSNCPTTKLVQTVVPSKYIEAVDADDWPVAQGFLTGKTTLVASSAFPNTITAQDPICFAAGNFSVLANVNYNTTFNTSSITSASTSIATDFSAGAPYFPTSGTATIVVPDNVNNVPASVDFTYSGIDSTPSFTGVSFTTSFTGTIPAQSLIQQRTGNNVVYLSKYSGDGMGPWIAGTTVPEDHVVMAYSSVGQCLIAIGPSGKLYTAPFTSDGVMGSWTTQQLSLGYGATTSSNSTLTLGPYKNTATYGNNLPTLPQIAVANVDGKDFLFIVGGANNGLPITSVYAVEVLSGGSLSSAIPMLEDITQPVAMIPFFSASHYPLTVNADIYGTFGRPSNGAFFYGNRLYTTSYTGSTSTPDPSNPDYSKNTLRINSAKVFVGNNGIISTGPWNTDVFLSQIDEMFATQTIIGDTVVATKKGVVGYVNNIAVPITNQRSAGKPFFDLAFNPLGGRDAFESVFAVFDNSDGTKAIALPCGLNLSAYPTTWVKVPVSIPSSAFSPTTASRTVASSSNGTVLTSGLSSLQTINLSSAVTVPTGSGTFVLTHGGVQYHGIYAGSSGSSLTNCYLRNNEGPVTLSTGDAVVVTTQYFNVWVVVENYNTGSNTFNIREQKVLSGANVGFSEDTHVAPAAQRSSSTGAWTNATDDIGSNVSIPVIVHAIFSNDFIDVAVSNIPFALVEDVNSNLPITTTVGRRVSMLNIDRTSRRLLAAVQWVECDTVDIDPVDACSVQVLDWNDDYPISAWSTLSQVVKANTLTTSSSATIPIDKTIGFTSSGTAYIFYSASNNTTTFLEFTYTGLQSTPPALTGCKLTSASSAQSKNIGIGAMVLENSSPVYNEYLSQIRSV